MATSRLTITIDPVGTAEEMMLQAARDARNAGVSYRKTIENCQRAYVLTVLEECGFNQIAAAEMLHMHRNSLSRLMRDLGIPHRPLKKGAQRDLRLRIQ